VKVPLVGSDDRVHPANPITLLNRLQRSDSRMATVRVGTDSRCAASKIKRKTASQQGAGKSRPSGRAFGSVVVAGSEGLLENSNVRLAIGIAH
jgi:hypothetical protein